MTPSYDLGKIRTLLTEGFSDEELRTLAFDVPGFKPVHHQLAQNSGKSEIVSRLLEYAERTHQLAKLLELAKAHNLAKYAEDEPYAYDDAADQSPYRGLQYFDVGDADLFFGRELLTARLVGRLNPTPSPALPLLGGGGEAGSHFLAVVGASGSGKSSVVRAGLVPALQRGQPLADGNLPPEGSSQWPIHIITPTAHPLEALAASLTRDSESVTTTTTLMDDMSKDPRILHLYTRKLLSQPSNLPTFQPSNLLLIVDQFEELFTLCRHEDERRAFVDNLLTAVDLETAGPTLVVLTLRADFYAHCAQYDNLRDALARQQEYIGPMSVEELRQAIELPAQRAGYEFEPGLIELILRDVGDEPGALPLLSHALLETWRRRQGRVLTLAGYDDAGGVRQAIAQTAESVFNSLTLEQQSIARRIFLRLTELGEGAQDTRRRVDRNELEMMSGDSSGKQDPVLDRPSLVAAVLQTLVAARLVTTDQDTAEVAHEALIREWPALRQWLNDNREELRLHRQLSEAAQEWEKLQREAGTLYRGARLALAGEWAKAHADELNALEHQFLTTSKQTEENERLRELEQARALAEVERQRAEIEARTTRRVRRFAIGLALLLLMAMGAAIFGWVGQNQARRQANLALAQLWQAQGRDVFETKPLLGLRLALEGWALAHPLSDQYTQKIMAISIRKIAQHGRLLTLGQGDVENIFATDDYPSVFILDRANTLGELRRTADGALVTTLSGPINDVDFSPNKIASDFVVVYSDNTPGELRRTVNGLLIKPFSDFVSRVDFSPNGTYLVVRYEDNTPAELRRTADGQIIAILSHAGTLPDVTFSPDDTYVFLTYRIDSDVAHTELRRTTDGTIVPLSDSVFYVGFSPNGTYLEVHYEDNTPDELRRIADGTILPLSGSIFKVTFSPDETYFVVVYKDNTPAELRRTISGQVIATLSLSNTFDPMYPYYPVTFSPDGTYLE